MSNKLPRYFSWNPLSILDGEFEFHETAELAKAAAMRVVEAFLDGESFADEEAEGICWGEIHEIASFVKVHEHGKGTPCWDSGFEDGETSCSEGYPLEWDFALTGQLEKVSEDDK